MKRSLFVTVLMTILCGILWILFLAATHQTPIVDTNATLQAEQAEATVTARQ